MLPLYIAILAAALLRAPNHVQSAITVKLPAHAIEYRQVSLSESTTIITGALPWLTSLALDKL